MQAVSCRRFYSSVPCVLLLFPPYFSHRVKDPSGGVASAKGTEEDEGDGGGGESEPAVLEFRALKHVESRVRVRYKETDQMGIAHHSNYIVWFEIGRTDLCRAAGITYAEIEARGFLLVVTEVGCRYRSPFRYDEEVLIRTSLATVASRAMTFAYELYDGSGQDLRASGLSSHLWLDRETRRPVRADAKILQAFEAWRPEEKDE